MARDHFAAWLSGLVPETITDIRVLDVGHAAWLTTGDMRRQIKKDGFLTPSGQQVQPLNWREASVMD